MADKARRKSSILKVAKTNPRAPLQDVNTLDVKVSQEEETSHTPNLRRRVSFAGKNFVKEFCSEADIASVHHAPEYEEWVLSTDSSGVIASDNSNNTHSSSAVIENHSVVQHKAQTSVLGSVVKQDDCEVWEQVMREFGSQSIAPFNVQHATATSRKTRFSFGEIHIPNNEVDLEDADRAGAFDTHPVLGNNQKISSITVNAKEGASEFLSVERNSTAQILSDPGNQITQPNTESEEVLFRESGVTFDTVRSSAEIAIATLKEKSISVCSQALAKVSSEIPLRECANLASPDAVPLCSASDVSDDVFMNIEPPTGLVDKTMFDDSGMDFTKPIPGIIQCGLLIPPFIQPEAVVETHQVQQMEICEGAELEHHTSQACYLNQSSEYVRTSSMNLTPTATAGQTECEDYSLKRIESPSALCNGSNIAGKDLNPMSTSDSSHIHKNQTIVMSTSMELTRPVPGNIFVEEPSERDQHYSKSQIMSQSTELSNDHTGKIIINVGINSVGRSKEQQDEKHEIYAAHGTVSSSVGIPPPPSEQSHQEENPEKCHSLEGLPSNIPFGVVEENDDEVHKNENVHFKSQSMSMSMDLTQPVPARIVTNLCIAQEKCTDHPDNNIVPEDEKVLNSSCSLVQPENTRALIQEMEPMELSDEPPLPRIIRKTQETKLVSTECVVDQANVRAMEFQNNFTGPAGVRSQELSPDEARIKEQGLIMPENGKSHLISTAHTENNTGILNGSGEEDVGTETSPKNAEVEQGMLYGSVGGTDDPFKSRPRLMSSPPLQALGEVPLPPIPSKEPSGYLSNLFMDVDEKETLNRSSIGKAVCGEDPFKSKPCPQASPIKPGYLDNVQVCESPLRTGVRTKEGNVDSVVNPLQNSCMLVDEPPPFQDNSMNTTIDISADISNPVENMLHSTIRTADLTLRQLQSPKWSEKVVVPENQVLSMECDPVPCGDSVMHITASLVTPAEESPVPSEDVPSKSYVQGNVLFGTAYNPDPDGVNEPKKHACSNEQDCDGHCASRINKSSKRVRDLSVEKATSCSADSIVGQPPKRLCGSPLGVNYDLLPNLHSTGSDTSEVLEHSELGRSTTVVSVAEYIYKNQPKYGEWSAKNVRNDLWLFKFKCVLLEMEVHLTPSLLANEKVEAFGGNFTSKVTESTKPIMSWAMKILMHKLSTDEWDTHLQHSVDFMCLLKKVTEEISFFKKFLSWNIVQSGKQDVSFTSSSLSFNITSFKCHLWFEVTLKLDVLENYTPDHVSVKNILGETRESEIRNLITGVRKNVYFLSNYIRDVKDYVRTLEEFS